MSYYSESESDVGSEEASEYSEEENEDSEEEESEYYTPKSPIRTLGSTNIPSTSSIFPATLPSTQPPKIYTINDILNRPKIETGNFSTSVQTSPQVSSVPTGWGTIKIPSITSTQTPTSSTSWSTTKVNTSLQNSTWGKIIPETLLSSTSTSKPVSPSAWPTATSGFGGTISSSSTSKPVSPSAWPTATSGFGGTISSSSTSKPVSPSAWPTASFGFGSIPSIMLPHTDAWIKKQDIKFVIIDNPRSINPGRQLIISTDINAPNFDTIYSELKAKGYDPNTWKIIHPLSGFGDLITSLDFSKSVSQLSQFPVWVLLKI